MNDLRSKREALGMSQWALSRASGLSRFKLQCAELGARQLPPEDEKRVRRALEAEAARLGAIASRFAGAAI